ncbi:divalent-cation tolerance protein CutA [Candidatus Woesearchaeota archaeon]|jgi:periplasmic divalent cation tolerance protein|nr:divalent-cation tolerance protein CutA [Candidatus Woesearchaeota archaeon]MDP6648468.1 divalent-cation tolerance protein CutA [Candidatus Woesearchaeota archaeon]|tara:strand:- start:28844 stop:29146 length:303 start_codon:yes stop_codon:yes gene_type:complete
MTLVYITCKDKKEAEKISLHLLKRKLIACANIFPVTSIYRWKFKIVNEDENILIVKTNNKKFNRVANEVKRIHSYDIPCILKLGATANKEYETWANKELK